jgi:hypothetical protein
MGQNCKHDLSIKIKMGSGHREMGSWDAKTKLHRKKSFSIFPSPAGISFTKLSLGGNYIVIYKLFLPRESLVSDIPAGDLNIEKLFFTV